MATRTWTQTVGNLASTAVNWSDLTAPVAGDIVVFDGTSSANCTWDITDAIASINTTGYGGLVTASVTMTVTGGVTFANSTFAHGSQLFKFTGDQTINLGTAGNSLYDVEANATDIILTLASNMTVIRNINFQAAVQNSKWRTDGSARTVFVGGDITSTSPYINISGGNFVTIEVNGTGSQSWTGAFGTSGSSYYEGWGFNININKASGTLTMNPTSGTFYNGGASSTFTWTAGTVDWSTNSVIYYPTHAKTFNTGSGMHFYKVSFPASNIYTLNADLYIDNIFLAITDSQPTFNGSSYKVMLSGDVDFASQYRILGTSTIEFTGSSNQAFTSIAGSAGGAYTGGIEINVTINKSGGTLTFSGGNTFRVGGSKTWTYTAGTVSTGTSTLAPNGACTLNTNGINWYKLYPGSAVTITLTSNLTVTNEYLQGNGTDVTFNGSTYNLILQGDVNTAGNLINIASGTAGILINGTANQTLDFNTYSPSSRGIGNAFTINKTGGTATFKHTTTTDASLKGVWFKAGFTYTAGTCDFTTNSVVIGFSGAQTISANGLVFYDVRYNGESTFTHSNSYSVTNTLYLGNVIQNVTLNGATIYLLKNLNTQGNYNRTISGTTTLEWSGAVSGNWTPEANGTGTRLSMSTPIIFNKSGGTLTIDDWIKTGSGGSITYTAGTISLGTITLEIGGSTTLNTNGMSWSDITVLGAYTVTLGSNCTVDDDWYNDVYGNVTLAGAYTLYIKGDFLYKDDNTIHTFGGSSTTIEFNGTGAQTFQGQSLGGGTTGDQAIRINSPVIINKASGTLTFTKFLAFNTSLTFTQGACDFGSSYIHYNSSTAIVYTAGALTVGTSTWNWPATTTIPSGFIAAIGTFPTFHSLISNNSWLTNNRTITLGANITVTAMKIGSDNGGTITFTGNKFLIEGALTGSGNYSWSTAGTTTFEFSGSGTPSWDWSGLTIPSLGNSITINTSGTLSLISTLRYKTGTITYTAGTVNAGTSILSIVGSCTLNTNGMSWYGTNLGTVAPITITLSSNFTATGTTTFGTTTSATDLTINGYAYHAKGDITSGVTERNILGTTEFHVSGSGSQSWTWTAYSVSVFDLPVFIESTGGTVSLIGATFRMGGNWTHTTGTVDAGTSVVSFQDTCTITSNTMTFYSVTFYCTSTSQTQTLADPITVNGVLHFDSGNYAILDHTINGSYINAKGNLTSHVTNRNVLGTTVLKINGTGAQSLTITAYSVYYFGLNLTIDKASGTLTLSGEFDYGGNTLTWTQGTVDAGTSILNINSACTLNTNGMSWYAITMAANITLVSNLTLTQNWTKTAGTLSGAYAVVFNGTSVVSGATTFYNLSINAGKTVHLTSTQTFTVSGTFTANGSAGNLITLDATSGGSRANLVCNGTRSVSYVTATDIDSSAGSSVYDPQGTISNTVNWAVIPEPSVYDTVTVTEDVSRSVTNNLSVSDTVTVSENLTLSNSPLSINVNDSITVSESVSLTQVFLISVNEAISLTESITVSNLTINISVSDPITITESLTLNEVDFISVNDTVTITETVTVQNTQLEISVNDTVTLVEDISTLLIFLASVNDAISITENVQVSNPLLELSVFDSITVTETTVELLTCFISVVETISVTESVESSLTSFVTVNDTITVNEDVALLLPIDGSSVEVNDTVTISESVFVLQVFLISVVDQVSVAENLSVDNSLLALSVNDAVALTETTEFLVTNFISCNDAITITENITSTTSLSGIDVNDSITVSESVSITNVFLMSVSESITVSEVVAVENTLLYFSISENVSVNENVEFNLISYISCNDNINVNENLNISETIGDINVVDNVTVAENLSLLNTLSLAISEIISIAEQLTLENHLGFSVNDSITVQDYILGISVNIDYNISINDIIVTDDNNITVRTSISVSVSDVISISENTAITKTVILAIIKLISNMTESIKTNSKLTSGLALRSKIDTERFNLNSKV